MQFYIFVSRIRDVRSIAGSSVNAQRYLLWRAGNIFKKISTNIITDWAARSCVICDSNSNVIQSNEGCFIKKRNSRIFTFSILVCTCNDKPLYYASPETLAFVNLFSAIKGDVYRNVLKEMCLIFVYDHFFFDAQIEYILLLLLLYFSVGREGEGFVRFKFVTFREIFWMLLNIHVLWKILFFPCDTSLRDVEI